MKRVFSLILILLISSCSSATQFGTGVNITFDPRTIGMQIDDTIMQKSFSKASARQKYFVFTTEVRDGRIFLSGKVDEAGENRNYKDGLGDQGVRSVKNAITIRGQSNFKSTAKDILITSQLRSALIFNKKTKARNYTLETVNKNIYIFGIAMDEDEKKKLLMRQIKFMTLKKSYCRFI